MRRLATIAVALAFVALIFQGGGARACGVNVVDATISATISGGNASFVVTYPPETEVAGTIRLAPRPLVFTENEETGCWETGDVSARLIISGGNSEMATLIPAGHGPHAHETVLRLGGPLKFVCDPLTPGTVSLGPLPLMEPDIQDTFGNGSPTIILMEPDIEDPY
ncbi:MAG: hypothetical protein V1934_07055 [Methanobacteriota archaeon]